MKIAIINITGGGMSGGYRKYLQNIIPRMAAHPDVTGVLCASPASVHVQDWFQPLSNVDFVNCRPFRFLRNNPDLGLKEHLERFSPDVLLVPTEHYFKLKNVPVVNMVQNMEPLVSDIVGNPIPERFRNWIRRIDGKLTLKKSNRVIAISRYVHDFLVNNWNIPDEKIGIVYHGVDLPAGRDIHSPDIIPEVWKSQFLFTAGSIRPARGLEDVLNALKYLSHNSRYIPSLVIAGEAISKMMKYRKKLKDWIQAQNLSSKVCWAGNLTDGEMSWCYRNCVAFLMTSRVESFGMIACEAIAHGCICISANNPCLPEIFGDAAIYYAPKNGKALAEAIQSVLSWDTHQHTKMSDRARKRAAEFSWDVTAERTVAQLAKAGR